MWNGKKKAVTFSYDDGVRQDKRLSEIFNKYGMKASFNHNCDYMRENNFTKEEIRDIAKKHGLEVAEKPDSQDFYEGDYNELLQVKDKIGNIVDTDGKVLGQHNGIWNYTIGQRKGLGIASTEPLYVLELRKDTNEVVVGFKDKTMHNTLVATKMNWISIENLDSEMKCKVKIRSTQEPTDAIIRPVDNGDVEVVFDIMQKSIAVGQSAVFYNDDVVIGGGIIDVVK